MSAPVFPLSAIVGQEALVEALLVNAVAPDVGGVLVRGERGTAKSTAVRGARAAAPAGRSRPRASRSPSPPASARPAARCPPMPPSPSAAAPLVELPLGATAGPARRRPRPRRARLAGEQAFEPGLLARAAPGDPLRRRGQPAARPPRRRAARRRRVRGRARVEREAVSAEHDARFLLVGTMNPEEGELRPQLLDRFGLGVEVGAPTDPAVARRDRPPPAGLRARPGGVLRALGATRSARWPSASPPRATRLPTVRLPERELLRITGACAKLGVDGVRGDIVSARAARALAALDGADEVAEEHVRRAAALALAHRRRRDPLDGHMPTRRGPRPRARRRAATPTRPRRRPAGPPRPDRLGAFRQAHRMAPRPLRPRPPGLSTPVARRRTRRARRHDRATTPRCPPGSTRAVVSLAAGAAAARSAGARAPPAAARASIDSRPAAAGLGRPRARGQPARPAARRRCAPARARPLGPRGHVPVPRRRRQRIDGRAAAPRPRQGRAARPAARRLRPPRPRRASSPSATPARRSLIAPGAPLERAAAALGRAAHRRSHAARGGAARRRARSSAARRCATRPAARSPSSSPTAASSDPDGAIPRAAAALGRAADGGRRRRHARRARSASASRAPSRPRPAAASTGSSPSPRLRGEPHEH